MTTPSSSSSSNLVLSPRTAARLSRVNSSTGSFSHRSLQSFRTVSLPGLLPGTHLGILASGLLDKRRDGAVRGGWAKRLFILSTKSLHYYRKTEEFELFGKERGHVPLSDVGAAKVVPPEDAPYGSVEPGMPSYFIAVVSKKKSLLMFLRADTLDLATGWTNTINRAILTAKGLHFAPQWPIDVIQKFTSAASSNFDDTVMEENKEEETKAEANAAPRVLVISMATTTDYSPQTTRERLIKRQVDLRKDVELGTFRKKDFCILVLSDGEEVHIPQHMLGSDLSSLLTQEREVALTTPPRSRTLNSNVVSFFRIEAVFRCTRPPPVLLSPQNSGVTATSQPRPSAFSVAFPGGLGGLFLLSCVIAFWLAHPFEGLMKITIVVGFLLSVSQVTQFVLCAMKSTKKSSSTTTNKPSQTATKTSTSSADDLVFHIRIERITMVEQDQDAAPLTTTADDEASRADTDGPVTTTIDDPAISVISGGPLPFSQRFIAAEKGDEDKGRQRYENTLQWRQENDIDTILIRPHRTFDTIKKYYPQFFHGRSKTGLPVYYEQPGKIDLAGLKREGLSIDDLLQHYMYITEYLWRVIEPNDAGRSVTVLDVTGIGMSDLGGEVLDFIKRASAFTGAHYPERSAHIFIINIPGWFNMIWRMVKPMIDPVTREKVHMLKGSAILKELEVLIDLDSIPSDVGGRGCKLGESQEEQDLRDHVHKYLRNA